MFDFLPQRLKSRLYRQSVPLHTNSPLVHEGGLRLYSREFHSPRHSGRIGRFSLMGAIASRLHFVLIAALLNSCVGARPVNFPFDPIGGQSLNSSYAEMTPRISNRFIVYASDRRGNQDIFLYDTVAKRMIDLPGLNALDTTESSPSITEDGRYVVFLGSRQGRSGIYLYDREFRQLRNLTTNLQAEVRNPMISSDGNTIVFETNLRGQWDILVYNRFGQPLPGIDINPR